MRYNQIPMKLLGIYCRARLHPWLRLHGHEKNHRFENICHRHRSSAVTDMTNNIIEFLAHWGTTALSLWVAGFIFHGISFSNKQSLFISALLLGLANAIIRPVVILLTIPLTIFTFGFFLLVINALMMLLVSSVGPG